MVSNGYIQDFFGTDMMSEGGRQPIYDFKRNMSDGSFNCYTQEGTKFYSPVDGKVVAVCDGSWYNGGLGKAVAVEFGDEKIFIIGHLDEVNVEVGDYVDGWLDVLGVCGRTGFVLADQSPMLTLIALQKTN